ncbi:MAG: putative ABC transporter permease, partial [Chitinispirillaceae bacterium]|nr:putative ABC transporter permease [Chitinispirillaceae bacterium]
MIFSTTNIEQFCFLFFIYSFLGWICESLYKSIENRKFVNSGFLYGPYVPIYGFGSLLTISAEIFLEKIFPFEIRIIIYTILATILEYYTGLVCEVIFGVRLWDYSDKPFNIKGRVCLQYSLYWLFL